MPASSPTKKVTAWIADDGELDVLRSLLRERQISYADVGEEPPRNVDLLVSNPRRAIEVERCRARLAPRLHIVMAKELTRTMRQRLQRSSCDFIIENSVHPGALGLLLEYALYRGPERRENVRVPMGADVKLKVGWRQRRGLLVQLSERGCGVMLDGDLSGDDITLRLPIEWGGKRIDVPVRVLDHRTVKGMGRVFSLLFRRLDMETRRALRSAMRQAATEVGRLDPGRQGSEEAAKSRKMAKKSVTKKVAPKKTALRRPSASPGTSLQQPAKDAAPTPLALPGRQSPAKTSASDLPSDDRRQNTRAHYMRRVIATREGQAHVVIGQDISVGGMRIGKELGIMVGDDLKLALYGIGKQERVIVSARVVRDDGLAGLGVQFEAVSPETQERLVKLVDSIPILGRIKSPESKRPTVVVSEILDHESHDE